LFLNPFFPLNIRSLSLFFGLGWVGWLAGWLVVVDPKRTPYEADGFITAAAWSNFQRDLAWGRHSSLFVALNPTWPTEWRQTVPLLVLQDYMNTGDGQFFRDLYPMLTANTQLE
jgi:hypothetical protein